MDHQQCYLVIIGEEVPLTGQNVQAAARLRGVQAIVSGKKNSLVFFTFTSRYAVSLVIGDVHAVTRKFVPGILVKLGLSIASANVPLGMFTQLLRL